MEVAEGVLVAGPIWQVVAPAMEVRAEDGVDNEIARPPAELRQGRDEPPKVLALTVWVQAFSEPGQILHGLREPA